MYCTAVFRKMPSPRRLVPGTLRWTPGRTLGRHQPPGGQHFLEVLPQERAQRRTVEQIVDPVQEVPMLCVIVPQMVEQLVDILTTLDFLFPSRLSKCPRSCVHPALLAPSLVRRRRWDSWWKHLRSCLLSMSSGSLSSSPLTFQFALGVVLVDVFKVSFWTVFLLV